MEPGLTENSFPLVIAFCYTKSMKRELRNLKEIALLVSRGAIFYVGHSGGKDSQAMYAAIKKVVPHDQIRVIHADLGDIEHAGVKDHIRATIDHDLMIAEAFDIDGNKTDLFGMIRKRRASLDAKGKFDAPAFPSSAARFCTSDLKTGPIWREIRRDGHALVVNAVGIRAEESKARAKKIASRGSLMANKKNTNAKREAWDWWPISDWLIDEVWTEIAEAGQEPHAAYAGGNERLSCVFCIFGSRNDLRNGAKARPDLLAKFTALEIETRTTMFAGETLLERIAIEVNPRQEALAL
jgi:DNA sulfur modification protein DndC